jgi:osmotically inducible protein OsmC
MKRSANAIWRGDLKSGAGTITTPQSGIFDRLPYSFQTRFENEDGKEGTNPEELIAAAHAGCFAMQLSAFLAEAGHPAEQLDVTAEINLVPGTGITGSHLKLIASVPGMSEEDFSAQAERAKSECPVSKALGAIEVTLEAKLA